MQTHIQLQLQQCYKKKKFPIAQYSQHCNSNNNTTTPCNNTRRTNKETAVPRLAMTLFGSTRGAARVYFPRNESEHYFDPRESGGSPPPLAPERGETTRQDARRAFCAGAVELSQRANKGSLPFNENLGTIGTATSRVQQ